MPPNTVLSFLDELVFTKTGKHLEYLQKTILEGVLEGQKYSEIANQSHISEGHVRDVASELWKFLSEVLEEDISKSNIRAILRKTHFYNNIGRDVVSFNNIHICTNSLSDLETNQKSESKDNQPYLDLGNAPDICNFYGRLEELKTLEAWLTENGYRLVTILGLNGVGKTALSVKLVEKTKSHFDYVIWRSLRFGTTLDEILIDLLKIINGQTNIPQSIDKKLTVLIELIKTHKCLIILDDLQSLFSPGKLAGNYQLERENYQLLFKLVAEINHQSCLVLLSQEKPVDITFLEKNNKPVRSLILEGLGLSAKEILRDHNLLDEENWEVLINLYQGNPLWLELTVSLIQDLFSGRVADFLQPENLIFVEALQGILEEQFQRLTEQEKKIIIELANLSDAVCLKEIFHKFSLPSSDLLNLIHSLVRRIVIKTKQENKETVLYLNPVLKLYVVDRYLSAKPNQFILIS